MKPNIIAIASDAALFPAAAFLASRLASLNPRDDTEVVIFSESLPYLASARDFGVPADLRHVALSAELPSVIKRISGATFMRLLIPELATDEVRRILYLDVDTFPEDDRLFRLFDLDMGGHVIAAVRDVYMAYCNPSGSKEIAKGGVSITQYLNAGVLLIDRGRFVTGQMRHRTLNLAIRHKLHDQAAINRALGGNWLELSPAMNTTPYLRDSPVPKVVPPAITHFMGEVKPWHGPRFAMRHPARQEIERYLLASPWKSFLGKHFNFRRAWDMMQAAQGRPTWAAAPPPQTYELPASTDIGAIAAYLRDTPFADVSQGITSLDLSALDAPDFGAPLQQRTDAKRGQDGFR